MYTRGQYYLLAYESKCRSYLIVFFCENNIYNKRGNNFIPIQEQAQIFQACTYK